jgi:hypothetical protein
VLSNRSVTWAFTDTVSAFASRQSCGWLASSDKIRVRMLCGTGSIKAYGRSQKGTSRSYQVLTPLGHCAIDTDVSSACLPTLRPVVNRVFNTSHESAEATSSRMPRIWTIGGSGAPSSRRSRRKVDESLLASTIASTIDESTHRFEAIPESRGVSQESRYSAKPSLRSSVQGHELNDIAKPSSTFTPQ